MEVTNAAGLSAYNKAERRLYHLSKELTGVVLQHDTYGSHIVNGETVDSELEMKNFQPAGEVLCSIWNKLEIDNYKTVAEYVKDPPSLDIMEYVPTAEFRRDHCFESQYMCVYLKCKNEKCCEPFRTNVQAYFPHRHIPPLIPIKRTAVGVEPLDWKEDVSQEKLEFLPLAERILFEKQLISSEIRNKYGELVPYDLFFPTVKEKIPKRVCKKCLKYHATIKSLNLHKKVCKKSPPKKLNKRFLLIENAESESEEPVVLQGELRDEIYDSDHEGEDGDRFAGMYIL